MKERIGCGAIVFVLCSVFLLGMAALADAGDDEGNNYLLQVGLMLIADLVIFVILAMRAIAKKADDSNDKKTNNSNDTENSNSKE